jgi:enterochelin esterase-like enzyme
MRRLPPLLLLLALLLPACAQATAGAADATPTTSVPSTLPPALTLTPQPTGSPTHLPAPGRPPSSTPTAAHTPTPTLSPTPTPCADRHGAVLTDTVPSAYLGYDIDLQVYLPPCYRVQTEARYPVLYLIHGLNFTQDQWVRLGVAEAADDLIAAGAIAPLLIVMPRDRRDIRLDPAFITDLLPYVDSVYRTQPDRDHRAIGGLSRGGGWSLHLGLRYPNLFGRVGGHSPAIFLGDENNILAYTRAIARDGPVPALYLDVGDTDAQRQSAIWLDQIFSWFEFEHTYVLQPGGHTEAYWSSHLDDYLRFYAADWLTAAAPRATPGFR